MTLTLYGLGAATVLELLLWLRPFWYLRRVIAVLAIVGLSLGSVALVLVHPAFWTAIFVVFSGYRLINMLRILAGHTQPDYLLGVARVTTLWLLLAQAAILVAAYLTGQRHVEALSWWYSLAIIQLVSGLIILKTTLRSIKTTRPPQLEGGLADKDLPSLTVCIPARNETEELSACLDSLVSSSYPKLEIIVLDDCSQNKRTPQIIRSFAQAGVRFIAGQSPPSNWLAKNFAYEQLYNQSNGELLLFCGVDTRFAPGSLTALVKTMLLKQKSMCSILPRNILPGSSAVASIVQANRYAWELSLPRRHLSRPPVLSTCWIISRELLADSGSFKAVTRQVVPESYFANSAIKKHDGYSFIQAEGEVDIHSEKQLTEQEATAIRTRYPQLHRRPELAACISVGLFLLLVSPLPIALAALWAHIWILAAIAASSQLLLSIFYTLIVQLTYRRFLWRSLWLLPFAALFDIGVLNYSMWKYEFSSVLWKGRNVCLPVMHVIPSLPKLP